MNAVAKILFVTALCGFLVSFAISFQSVGMSHGLTVGDNALKEYRAKRGEQTIEFSGSGYNTYDRLASAYWLISLLFLAVVGASILSNIRRDQSLLLLLHTTGFLACALILYNLRFLIRDKSFSEAESFVLDAPRNGFLKLTIVYDWFFVLLAIVLIGLQAASVISIIRETRRVAS